MERLILEIPALIKAKTEAGGRRVVEVEASNESVDSEGDIILQQALLDAGPSFVKTGNLDIDHISEVGERYNIANPTSYIVGRPTEVKDIGGGRTSVVGEIRRAKDGSFDAKANKFDEFWQSLNSDPPVNWRASIYGFPTPDGLIDCTRPPPGTKTYGATRYLVTGINWRSLAFTRNPVNDAIKGVARVLTQKAFHEIMKANLAKNYPDSNFNASAQLPPPLPQYLLAPRNREELIGHFYGHIKKGNCPYVNEETGGSVYTFRQHFMNCCCEPDYQADIQALALMQLLKHSKRA